MAEEKTINLFQTESNPDPYAGRDPSLYGTVAFPTANFITMVKSGEITYDPEDTMHQQALQEYQAVYDEATDLDKANMLDPAKILAGAAGGTALGYLGGKVGSYFDPKTVPTPTEKVLLREQTPPFDIIPEGKTGQVSSAPVSQGALQDIKTDFISEAGKFENIGRGVGAGIGVLTGDLYAGRDPLKSVARAGAVGVSAWAASSLFKGSGLAGFAAGGLVEAVTRVICNELLRQGLMTRRQVLLDYKFTDEHLSEQHVRGYHFWAIGVVKRMRKGKGVGFWRHIATHRANEIEYIYGKREKPDYLGKVYRRIFEPTCWLIGAFCQQKDHTVLYGERS
jgi:hypothetical protein